jgi:crotonobetainyl-CoA:carnitine CoA-transferase CaiB-like acyl-CoA transferase
MASALAGLKVLDLSESVAGQFCGRMLADYGADVTLIEPPGGSAVRAMQPFDPVHGDSLLFFHINTGKKSLVLDQASNAGRALLLRLMAAADVAIVGRDADVDALAAANADAVICVVSGFGRDGPWRDWQGAEIVYQALSGMMNHNGMNGREPLYGVGQRGSHSAGLAAYIGILAALEARPREGGQVVSIDIAETLSSMWYPYTLMHAYSGWLEPRGERGQPVGQARCRDDDWVVFWVRPNQWGGVCNAIGRPDLVADPRFATYGERIRNWRAVLAVIQEFTATMDADDVLARWQQERLICAKAFRATELWRLPHLRERGFWESVETPGGPRPILGPQFRMSETPRAVRGGAPAIGDTGEQR